MERKEYDRKYEEDHRIGEEGEGSLSSSESRQNDDDDQMYTVEPGNRNNKIKTFINEDESISHSNLEKPLLNQRNIGIEEEVKQE